MSQSGRFQIRIIGPSGDRIERLDKTEVVIGRSAQADIVVPHPEVSRRHVTLRIESGQVIITDEGSKNGTFIDEERLASGSNRPWQEGQTLRMGLSPERLVVERVADHRVGVETPPPVDSFENRTSTKTHALKDISLSQLSIHGVTATKANDLIVARSEVKPSTDSGKVPTESKPSLVADLERQMQDLLANAENEAKALRASAERECQSLKATAERDLQRFKDEQGVLKIEKSKLESQLREMETELRTRTEERKQSARENAEAKLAIQTAAKEVERLTKAKEQLGLTMGEELAALEAKLASATFEADNVTEGIRAKAKRQADLLVSEAELKAKSHREKLQIEVADARRQLELDLADMKLKHTSEVKGAHDQQEAKWLKNRNHMVSNFLQEIRIKSETIVAGDVDGVVKSRLLTSIEESLHRHFLDGEPPPTIRAVPSANLSVSRIPDSPRIAAAPVDYDVTNGGGIRIADELPLPPIRRFNIKVISVAAAAVLGIGGAWTMLGESAQKLGRQIASQVSVQSATQPSAQPAPQPHPPAAQVLNPPPPPQEVAPAEEVSNSRTWTEVVTSRKVREWQSASGRYLQKSLKVDRRNVTRFQILESQLASSLAAVDGRSPAGVRERARIEEQFLRDAGQLLGAGTLQKLAEFRDYFMSKNQ